MDTKKEELNPKVKDWYKILFDLATDAMFIYSRGVNDTPSKFIEVNQAACQLLGYSKEELLNLSILDITPKEMLGIKDELRKKLQAKKHIVFETVRRTKTGEIIPVENHASRIEIDNKPYFLVITRDIQERKQAEAAIRVAEDKVNNMEKLATVGQITSGIAHDIRNPLNVISNATGLIEKIIKDNDTDARLRKLIEQLKLGVIQATNTVSDLMASVREPKMELVKIFVYQQIGNIIRNFPFPKNVKLIINNSETLKEIPPINGDAQQLERVFHNLVKNAVEAMPDGGNITITPTVDGSFLKVEITDTGTGIPKEHLTRIFDPLYSLKVKSGGTGIGLSVCKSVIEAHGGTIEVESEEEKGTRFTIRLPIPSK